MITNVSSAFCAAGSVTFSASSNTTRKRLRIVARILESLQPRRDTLPFRMAEVRVPRARRDDQKPVRNLAAIGDDHTPVEVDVGDCCEQHTCVALPAEEEPGRNGNVRGGRYASGHLVEQRGSGWSDRSR
jgi:hypothetical protein